MRPIPTLLAATLLLAASPAGSREEPQPLVETQRVTAFDLVVEIARRGEPERSTVPARLEAGEFSLVRDGRPLPVVTLATGRNDPEPWRIVVYADRQLSSDPTLRWAAMELAERAARLAELGEVEIVVADPEPRRVLAASRDPGLIDQSLSGLFLATEAGNELVARREEHLLRHPRAPAGELAATVVRRAERAEAEVVRRQLDRLLGWLVEAQPATPRRALLLLADGFDLRPAEFYAGRLVEPAPGAIDLAQQTRTLAETLGAYGWIVGALAPPAPEPGFGRFGVFFVRDPSPPWLFTVSLRSLAVWLDRNRNPKKADAFAELGRSLREQGRLEEAAAAYRKSVYHYYDHPKSARRQAAALVGLGETLELMGDERDARQTFRAAVLFDRNLAPRYPFVDARLLAPRAPLEQLADDTAGALITDRPGLDRLLGSLADRVRLTSQLAGPPDGELHGLELGFARPAFVLRHPRLARWGTPPAVAGLRLRRLLEEEPEGGELELRIAVVGPLRVADGLRRLRLELRVAPRPGPDGGGEPPVLVVSWGSRGAETPIRYRTRAVSLPAAGEAPPIVEVELPEHHPWLALLVEELVGGAWGGAALELAAR